MPRLQFSAVDRVSRIAFPFGATFAASDGRRAPIFGLSGLALGPDFTTLLALCDRSRMLTARVEFNKSSFELANISWLDQWDIYTEDGGVLDSEGLALLPSGEVLVSTEPGPVYALPPMIEWTNRSIIAKSLHSLPDSIMEGVEANKGLESLTALPDSTSGMNPIVLTALEGPIAQDAPLVFRLFELDAATGDVRRQAVLRIPANEPTLLLSELAAVDAGGLSHGGQFLALERGWSPEAGNEVRLYLLDATDADDVTPCVRIVDVDGPHGSTSSIGNVSCMQTGIKAVHKELLLQWTRALPLAGWVPVDNYEGMVIVPPAAFGLSSDADVGGIAVLLVNDDNNNPLQIGTQFVLMRLPFAIGTTPAPDHTNTLIVAIVIMSLLLTWACLVVAFCCRMHLRSGQQRWHEYRREELEEPGGASVGNSGTQGRSRISRTEHYLSGTPLQGLDGVDPENACVSVVGCPAMRGTRD